MINSQENNYLAQTYDDIPYTSNAFHYCQATRLHALAKIKGLNPAPLETANILEIGCSFGGNLLPFAIRYPNSRIIGIDLSEYQINIGQQMMKIIGVDNIDLVVADISKVIFENITFDYIICHGVFSWVPESIRDAILSTIQNYLSPNGIAFISYNTYPGWKIKDIEKDLMLFGSNANLPKMERIDQALQTLEFTQNILDRSNNHYSKMLCNYFQQTAGYPKYYVAHEQFETFNQPLYFKDFIQQVDKYGLGYVTSSDKLFIQKNQLFKDDEFERLCDFFHYQVESIEQFIDFLESQVFRLTLITHKSNLEENNITNKIEQYNQCQHFYHIYLKCFLTYHKADEAEKAYWNIGSFKVISDPFYDHILAFLEKQDVPLRIDEIDQLAQQEKFYDKNRFIDLMLVLINQNNTYLCFSPEKIQTYSKQPKLSTKYYNFIQFVKANPGITNLSSRFYEVVKLDIFQLHLSQYLDGTRTIEQLCEQIRNDFDSELIKMHRNGNVLPKNEIEDKDIEEAIQHSLNVFEQYGYFNEY